MPKIVLVEPMHPAGAAKLEAQPGFEVIRLPAGVSQGEILAAAEDADAIGVRILPVPAALTAQMPHLKTVAKHGVGVDNIEIAPLTARGIPVTVTADANKTSVVEHTLMFLLALAKKLVPLDAATRAGNFHVRSTPAGFGVDLKGRTILVIGVGRIGADLIPVLRALGMNVLAHDPLLTETQAADLGCERVKDFRAHLGRADAVTVHVPLSANTRGLIGARELAALPNHAFIINTARGGIINEAALLHAIQTEQIAGAATDVFDGEPPAANHPFFAEPRILLAPHTGGNTVECLERMAVATAENIIAALNGTVERRIVVNAEVLPPQ